MKAAIQATGARSSVEPTADAKATSAGGEAYAAEHEGIGEAGGDVAL
jgi:hypothetical protein